MMGGLQLLNVDSSLLCPLPIVTHIPLKVGCLQLINVNKIYDVIERLNGPCHCI
jgi:hypothetical protein